ncbi:MAG TPA: GAF domain-containing protein [Anaerolineales bacterium]
MSNFAQRLGKLVRAPWLPWAVVGVTLLFALLHEVFQAGWLRALSKANQAAFWGLALTGFVLLYLLISGFWNMQEERDRLMQRLLEADRKVNESGQRLESIFQISQKFVEASEEQEVIDLVLRLAVNIADVKGASFVPLDDHGQPLQIISFGSLPRSLGSDWVEYLASPAVRARCQACTSYNSLTQGDACPLAKGSGPDGDGLFCLPLRRGEHEFGVMNIYLPGYQQLDAQSRTFLLALADETSLALEGVRLRRRELAAIRQMQSIRQKTDLGALLKSLLENVQQTLESDFAILVIREPDDQLLAVDLSRGDFRPPSFPFINGILQGVMDSCEPVLMIDVIGDPAASSSARSLMAAPLLSPEHLALGALLVSSSRPEGFHQRQFALLQTIAGQGALLVHNAHLMQELEYNTVIQERIRLAREIHDGLAQTLGFLKLQVAQMQNYRARGEIDRLQQSLDLVYATLSETYEDVRLSIDNLRISPDDPGLSGWIEQTVDEFRDATGLAVNLDAVNDHAELPPEIHAQLIRIVQEALSNIRKHAQASQIWVSCQESDGELCLEIRDNGRGFAAEDVVGSTRHGLRGMRERAELIGSDFQVISRPGEGTLVRVRLPLVGLKRGVNAV